MRTLYYGLAIVLISSSVAAQPDALPKERSVPAGPYWPQVNRATSPASRTTQIKRRLAGYVYQSGKDDLRKTGEAKVSYDLSSNIFYCRLANDDTLETRDYQMDAAFDYNYPDLLSLLSANGFANALVRDQGGSVDGDFLAMERREKNSGKWYTTSYMKHRTEVPYGFEYADNFAYVPSCPLSWEYTSKGEWQDDLWVRILEINSRECTTGSLIDTWQEVRKMDHNNRQVEFAGYKKEASGLVLDFRYQYKYDNKGRVIEELVQTTSLNQAPVKKWIVDYDDKGNALTSSFVPAGDTWTQDSKTDADRDVDGSYRYTHLHLVSGQWTPSYRETFTYDTQDRLVGATTQWWETSGNAWTLTWMERTRYHYGNLIAGGDFFSNFSGEAEGTRWTIAYNDHDEVSMTETMRCTGYSNFEQELFTPEYKAYYDHTDANTDAFSSWRMSDGKWLKFDSVSNRYNDFGEIMDAYSISYDGYPGQVGTQQKYTYSYREFVVTEVDHKTAVSVYPNPASEVVYVTGARPDGIRVVDWYGRNITPRLVEHLSEHRTVLHIDNLQPGVYFILFTRDGISPYRLMKR